MTQPKILVGCPTSEHKAYCLQAYATAIKALTYPCYDILLVDNSEGDAYSPEIKRQNIPVVKAPRFATARETIAYSRNVLRKEVLDKQYDYFLSLEQDVIPPKDIIERLLRHTKQVVTGVYFMEYALKKQGKVIGKKMLPLLYKGKDKDTVVQLTPGEVAGEDFLQVTAAGLGCILIHRSVLERIAFRYQKEKLVFDDIWFCQDLEKIGVPLYADTSVKCKHLMRSMDWTRIQK